MSTMLMELMHHLQDVHTHHPNDDGRVIVAVPTTPHAPRRGTIRSGSGTP